MDENIVTKICGMIPEGFVKVTPKDSNYIFQNDPSFSAINLYDFFGRAATVNSFAECFYYVELGFEPNKTTIFDYAFWISVLLVTGLILLTAYKKNFVKRLIQYFKLKKIGTNLLNIFDIFITSGIKSSCETTRGTNPIFNAFSELGVTPFALILPCRSSVGYRLCAYVYQFLALRLMTVPYKAMQTTSIGLGVVF